MDHTLQMFEQKNRTSDVSTPRIGQPQSVPQGRRWREGRGPQNRRAGPLLRQGPL